MTEITYTRQGDYNLPNLLPPQEEPVPHGKYALLRKKFLKEHRRVTYTNLLTSGKLNGHEFAVSNQLPNGSGSNRPTNVVLGNFSEFMIGRQGSMESEMFREGTVTDEDGNTISAVDQDCTILRIIDLHDFGIRHEESFVIGKNMQTQK